MKLRRLPFAPFYLLADWADDNPVSAIGAVVALGAIAALVGSVTLGNGADAAELGIDATTAGVLFETALDRPAYLAAAAVGLAVVLFYNG